MPHHHPLTIALHDTDAAGVLFFAHLLRHAHDTYEGFMAALGFPLHTLIAERELGLPVVHAEADYRRPMRHGEQFTVEARVSEIGERSFRIAYRFLDAAGEPSATALTVHAVLSTEGRGILLPQALRSALTASLTEDRGD